MAHHAVKLEYPYSEIPIILKSSYKEDTFYGVDVFESKKIKLLMAKHGCRQSYHSLPGTATCLLHPFAWDRLERCFRIEMDKKEVIPLNTLEEVSRFHSNKTTFE